MKHCFLNESESFTREIDLGEGVKAIIRDLTDDDLDVISQKSGMLLVNTSYFKEPERVEQKWELHELKMRNYKLLLSLGGNIGSKSYSLAGEGLFIDGEKQELDYAKVNLLTPRNKKAIMDKILEREKFWREELEGLSKN